MRRKELRYLRWLVSGTLMTIFIVLVLQRVDLNLVGACLFTVDPLRAAVAILLVEGLSLIVRGIKWRFLLGRYGIHYSLARVLQWNLLGMFAGFLVSDGLGAFVKVFYVRRGGHPLGATLATVFLDKATQLAALLIVGVVILGYVPVVAFREFRLWLVVALLLLGTACWLFVRYWQVVLEKVGHWLAAYLRRSLNRLGTRVAKGEPKAAHLLRGLDWIYIVTLSMASLLLQYLAIYALVHSLETEMPFRFVLSAIIISSLTTFFPVTPGGIGTRDAALVLLSESTGVASENALTISILFLVLYLFWRLIGLVVYLLDPLDFKKAKPQVGAVVD